MPESFAATLRRLRRAAKLTQQQLADAAGVTTMSVKSYEGGRTIPGADVLAKMSEVLGVKLSVWEKCDWTRKVASSGAKAEVVRTILEE